MKAHNEEIHQRLGFINRTIFHAVRACHLDDNVPEEMKEYVERLGEHSSQAQQALHSRDVHRIRQSVDDLARISDQAQHKICEEDGMNYEVKSAVILTHIEVSALRHQLD
jgi:hypothetical protein